MRAEPVCAITGATGAIGPIVAATFVDAGFRVRCISRRGGNIAGPGLDPIPADVTDLDAIRRAVDGAEIVVHLAALLHVADPPPTLLDEYRRVNVLGTENVVRAATEAGVQRLIHLSTIAVYGSNRGALLTEESDPRPDTFYSVTKLQSERPVLNAGGTVLRLAAVYGSRVKGNYKRLVRSISRGRFIPIGEGRNQRTLVHEIDVSRAILLAAEHPAASGEIFNVTDGDLHSVREIVEAIAAAAGRPAPRYSLPVGVVRMGIAAVERMAGVLALQPPLRRSLLDRYTEEVAVSGEKIRRLLGFEAQYDLQRGWAEAVRMISISRTDE